MNSPRAVALCQCFTGALEYQAGHWGEAETALRAALRLYRELGAASGEALTRQRLGVLQSARGQLDEGMASFEEGVAAAERATMRAHCLTRLYTSMTRNRLLAGDLDAAGQYLDLGLTMGERHGNCATCDSLLLPVAVSLRAAQRYFTAAEAFCSRLEAAARKYASRAWVAMARQTRAELLGAQGQLDAALAAYAEAHAAFADSGNDYEAARCLDAIAGVWQARNAPGDLQSARAARTEAGRLLEQLGAARIAETASGRPG